MEEMHPAVAGEEVRSQAQLGIEKFEEPTEIHLRDDSGRGGAVSLRFMNDGSPEFRYRVGGEEGLDAVGPLWEKLRAYHAQLKWQFAGEMSRSTFENRKREILAQAAQGKIRVEVVSVGLEGVEVAYGISTVTANGRGEVDSIFVEEEFRGRGVGGELLRRALAWFDTVGASPRVVSVAYGNEGALALYQRFGFQPRTVVLNQRQEGKG